MKNKPFAAKKKNFLLRLRIVLAVLGRKGLTWSGVGFTFSFLLGGSEYALSAIMTILLIPLGFATPSQIPGWIPPVLAGASAATLLAAMLFTSVVRTAAELLTIQSNHVVFEYVNLRFRMIQGYELLMTDRGRSLPLSLVNLRMGELIPRASDFIFHSMSFLIQFLYGGVLLTGMLLLAWKETLFAALVMILMGVIVIKTNRRLIAVSAEIGRQELRMEEMIVRISRNWLFIRVMHLGRNELHIFLDAAMAYYRQAVKAFLYVNASSSLPRFLGMVGIAILILVNIYFTKTPPAKLLVFFYLFLRFAQAAAIMNDRLGKMGNYWHHFREMTDLAASFPPQDLKTAFAVEKLWPGAVEAALGRPFQETLQPRNGAPEIRVENVSFTWPGASCPVFERLSFTIPAGSHYGIVGPNGSGKSTLLGILLGVLKPETGEVRISGLEARQYIKDRNDLGFVGPDPYLFKGTILENLTYGNERQADSQEIMLILKKVHLECAIERLPEGLAACLGEGGEGFSTGEKQRLALGRALLRKPKLLILDEATANLDVEMEKEMAEILRDLHGQCTIITVTNNPGILRRRDDLLDMGSLPFHDATLLRPPLASGAQALREGELERN